MSTLKIMSGHNASRKVGKAEITHGEARREGHSEVGATPMNQLEDTDPMPTPKQNRPSGSSPRPCCASFWVRLLRKWDWWIYCRATHSLRRMTLDNPGMAYLMELQIRSWNEQLAISPELKKATEAFHESMRDHRHNVSRQKSPPESGGNESK